MSDFKVLGEQTGAAVKQVVHEQGELERGFAGATLGDPVDCLSKEVISGNGAEGDSSRLVKKTGTFPAVKHQWPPKKDETKLMKTVVESLSKQAQMERCKVSDSMMALRRFVESQQERDPLVHNEVSDWDKKAKKAMKKP